MNRTFSTTRPLAFFGADRENREILGVLAEAHQRSITSPKLLNGPSVFELEDNIALVAGRGHCAAVNSATDGLYFAAVALGLGEGDEVLVPAFSFIATASAILRTGARPVFVDIAWDGGDGLGPCTMDLEDAARKLTSRTRAMVWVDLFGGASDPKIVASAAENLGIRLMCDCSQGFGSRFGGVPSGKLGDVAVFSFDRNKTLAAPGTGGAVVSDDPEIDRRVRELRYHGVSPDGHVTLGYNSQMSSATASSLSAKLPHLQRWAVRRGQIAQSFDAALAAIGIKPLAWPPQCRHVWHKYAIMTPRRDEFEAHMRAFGIPTKRHYDIPLSRQPLFSSLPGGPPVCPEADRLAGWAVSLPIFAQMTDTEVERIVSALTELPPR